MPIEIETRAMMRRQNVFDWKEEIWNLMFPASLSSWLTEGVLIGIASTFGVSFTKVALTGFLAVFNMAIFANSLPFAKVNFLDDDIFLNF